MDSSIVQLKQAGVQAVITLMPDQEMARFEAETLPALCRQHHLEWFHLPVEDDAAPTAAFEAAWHEQRQQVHRLLDENGTVAVHCRGGSGRTGLMAAIILMERGFAFDQAVSLVQVIRPNAVKLTAHVGYLTRKNIAMKNRGG